LLLIWQVGTVGLYGRGLFLACVINPYLAFVALRAFFLSNLGIAWLLLVAGVLSARAVVQRRIGNR